MEALGTQGAWCGIWDVLGGLTAHAGGGGLSVLSAVVCACAMMEGRMPRPGRCKGVIRASSRGLGGDVLEVWLVDWICVEKRGDSVTNSFDDAQDGRRLGWWDPGWGAGREVVGAIQKPRVCDSLRGGMMVRRRWQLIGMLRWD